MQAEGMWGCRQGGCRDAGRGDAGCPRFRRPGPDTGTSHTSSCLRLEHPWTSTLLLRALGGRWSGSFGFTSSPSSHPRWEQKHIPTQGFILGGFCGSVSTKEGVKPAAHPNPPPGCVGEGGTQALGCKWPLQEKVISSKKVLRALNQFLPW